ncbi:MAG: hypothetical protein WBA17_18335 [Saprospiraceae bacterium]
MFSFSRLGHLLRLDTARHPWWYYLLPVVIALGLPVFLNSMLLIENQEQQPFVLSPAIIGTLLSFYYFIALFPIALHLIGRHLQREEAGAYLTLPVGSGERYFSLLLQVVVLLPLYGLLIALLTYALLLLGLLAPGYIRIVPLAWVDHLLLSQLKFYWLPLAFGIGLAALRPNYTLMWAAAIVPVVFVFYAGIATNTNIESAVFTTESQPQLDLLYTDWLSFNSGSPEKSTYNFNVFQYWWSTARPWRLYGITALASLVSAYFVIVRKQA